MYRREDHRHCLSSTSSGHCQTNSLADEPKAILGPACARFLCLHIQNLGVTKFHLCVLKPDAKIPPLDSRPPIISCLTSPFSGLLQIQSHQLSFGTINASSCLVPHICATIDFFRLPCRQRWLYDGVRQTEPVRDST